MGRLVPCNHCRTLSEYKSESAAAGAKTRHANKECASLQTTEADKDRYAQATLRENNARKLGTAIRGLLAEQDDGQVVHIKCAHCKKGLTYMKTDATAAYIHHYGEYCTRPCALRGAPVATGSDKAAAGKLGEWRRSMEEMRDKALAQLMDQPAHWTTPTADTATSQPATPEPANPWANSRPLPSPPTSPGKRHFDGDGESGTPFKTPRQKTDPNLCHGPATDHFDQDGALGNEDASAAADAVMEDDTGSQQGEMQHEVSAPATPITHSQKSTHAPTIRIDKDWGELHHQRYEQLTRGLSRPPTCRLSGTGFVIKPHCMPDYTVLLERLKAADIEHTFRTPKTAATVRLVAKRLPVGIAESTVQEALGALQVRGVHRLTVPAAPGEGPRPRALTAAVCAFPAGTKLEAVAAAAPIIGGFIVKWEIYKNMGEIPQCYKCQDFFHTSRQSPRAQDPAGGPQADAANNVRLRGAEDRSR
ncbi:Kinesin-like protein KIF21A [Frankliniella fusca]|uniref:Kinesin-like protein KIF21A n=1 Tax=Frankliniella fusca TaxID=407009 RepID=A0AAE1LUK4_9NEOP|nr:Kinesin-like protein KIF21A [Frankliniella fusca]